MPGYLQISTADDMFDLWQLGNRVDDEAIACVVEEYGLDPNEGWTWKKIQAYETKMNLRRLAIERGFFMPGVTWDDIDDYDRRSLAIEQGRDPETTTWADLGYLDEPETESASSES